MDIVCSAGATWKTFSEAFQSLHNEFVPAHSKDTSLIGHFSSLEYEAALDKSKKRGTW